MSACDGEYLTRAAQISRDAITADAPGFARVAWVLQSIALPGAFFVTALYWALVFNGTLHMSTPFTHGVNFLLMVIDVIFSRQVIHHRL